MWSSAFCNLQSLRLVAWISQGQQAGNGRSSAQQAAQIVGIHFRKLEIVLGKGLTLGYAHGWGKAQHGPNGCKGAFDNRVQGGRINFLSDEVAGSSRGVKAGHRPVIKEMNIHTNE